MEVLEPKENKEEHAISDDAGANPTEPPSSVCRKRAKRTTPIPEAGDPHAAAEHEIEQLSLETQNIRSKNMELEKDVVALERERRRLRDEVDETERLDMKEELESHEHHERVLLRQIEGLKNGTAGSGDDTLIYRNRMRNATTAIDALHLEREELSRQQASLKEKGEKRNESLLRLNGMADNSAKATRTLEQKIRQLLVEIGSQQTKSTHQQVLSSY
jgi:hypothetical protein